MTTKVRILGDRQHGKTELLLAAASGWVRTGQQVLFLHPDWKLAHNNIVRFERYADEGMKFWYGAGNKEVRHESGGRIVFASTTATVRYTGVNDVVVIDDIPHLDIEYLFPTAHIYRTYV